MPPLAFIDDEDTAPPVSPVRRALSTGTAPASSSSSSSELATRRPPRPQSVGALTAPPSSRRRLSLQSVTEAVSIGGKEMSRLRLSLVRHHHRRPSQGEAEAEGGEMEEGHEVLGTTSVLLPPAAAAAGAGAGHERRCQSVTVSLEEAEVKEQQQQGKQEEKEEEGALNVEIEQAEGVMVSSLA